MKTRLMITLVALFSFVLCSSVVFATPKTVPRALPGYNLSRIKEITNMQGSRAGGDATFQMRTLRSKAPLSVLVSDTTYSADMSHITDGRQILVTKDPNRLPNQRLSQAEERALKRGVKKALKADPTNDGLRDLNAILKKYR
jgi:hypothetical protein